MSMASSVMSSSPATSKRSKGPSWRPGQEALAAKGWLRANKWLLARRLVQTSIFIAFLAGPWYGLWIVTGNLSSSLVLDVLPLTDPYLVLQSLAAGHVPLSDALLGAGIVLLFYLAVGGRVYCSWVCPVNIVTDGAAWLRRRLNIKTGRTPPESLRYWLMAAMLAVAFVTGGIAWELVNPVSMLHRGIIVGFGFGWAIVAGVFVYDVLVANRGWCGHVCPVGAFYALLGKTALLRVSANKRVACNDCMDCFAVCPEPQVIRPALKQVGQTTPIIGATACTNCGRCVDVCSKDVFRFTIRFDQRSES